MAAEFAPARVDPRRTLRAGIILSGMAYVVGNLFPFFTGGLAEELHFGPRELGYISSLYILCAGAVVATAPLWIRRIEWRGLTVTAMVLTAASLAGATAATSFATALAAFAACGVFIGLMQATVFTGLGDSDDPQRAYGWSLSVQMAIQSVLAVLATSYILPRWGGDAFLGLVAALFILTLPFCGAIASKRHEPVPMNPGSANGQFGFGDLAPPLIGLAAIAFFMAGIFSIWFFLERIANDAGVSVATLGWAVAISGIVTIVTAAGVASLGSRIPALIGIGIGALVSGAGVVALWAGTSTLFVAGVCGLSIGWGIGQPFLWGLTTRIDRTKRLFSASPAALGLGGAIGTALAGECAELWGLSSLLVFASSTLGMSVLIAAVANHLARRRYA